MTNTEWYEKHRPKTLGEIVGQEGLVKTLAPKVKAGTVPHVLLFTGGPGTGKSTTARVVASLLVSDPKVDVDCVDCASEEPMDAVRRIKEAARYKSFSGGNRVWVLEEFQSMSRATSAQQALLLLLEGKDTPHAYFFLTSTDPTKINKALRSRATELRLAPLAEGVLFDLVLDVAKKEGVKLSRAVAADVAKAAEGNARRALVLLEQIAAVPGDADRAMVLASGDQKKQAFDLVRAMLPFKGKADWGEAVKVLNSIQDEEPEKIRALILSCAKTTLLTQPHLAARANMVIQLFRDPLYSGKVSDHAVLAACVWEACHPKGG